MDRTSTTRPLERRILVISKIQFLLLLLLLLLSLTRASETSADTLTNADEEHSEPGHAVLFPSFALTLGVLVFYLLARYAHALPYTAIMFLLGTLMGIGVELLDGTNHVSESIRLWIPIDSEVLLLVFLPGLIFKDAMGQNVHFFRIALTQCIIFAVPMVLAGTTLTALIAKYIFPYGWSFNLAMTFGSM